MNVKAKHLPSKIALIIVVLEKESDGTFKISCHQNKCSEELLQLENCSNDNFLTGQRIPFTLERFSFYSLLCPWYCQWHPVNGGMCADFTYFYMQGNTDFFLTGLFTDIAELDWTALAMPKDEVPGIFLIVFFLCL